MSYVVTAACIGTASGACREDGAYPCVEACPVDGIFGLPGDPQLYADADECIDCGACYVACPVGAIMLDYDIREEDEVERAPRFVPLDPRVFSLHHSGIDYSTSDLNPFAH
jgi:ferredoxin